MFYEVAFTITVSIKILVNVSINIVVNAPPNTKMPQNIEMFEIIEYVSKYNI